MIKKGMFVLIAFAMMATPAFADTRPEFDAVGCDISNIFAQGFIEQMVNANAPSDPLSADAVLINEYSSFIEEEFTVDDGAPNLKTDPCFNCIEDSVASAVFPELGIYESHVAVSGAAYGTEFEWKIVLQMQPYSDVDLSIRDCVLTPQGLDIWRQAGQTGRYVEPTGATYFHVSSSQPHLTVKAEPGWNAHPSWQAEYCGHHCRPILFGRTMPGIVLRPIPLRDIPFTSKGLWEESILIVVPQTGERDCEGRMLYRLSEGDVIVVKLEVPMISPVDVRYGEDNVILRYVGMVNTELIDEACGEGEDPCCDGCSKI
jgi:hypothetical protein